MEYWSAGKRTISLIHYSNTPVLQIKLELKNIIGSKSKF